MSQGIKITNGEHIPRARGKDYVLNTLLRGGFKVNNIYTFFYGGEKVLYSSFLGLYGYVQFKEHGLSYVPAYLAFAGYGTVDNPTFIQYATANFVSIDNSDAVANVDSKRIMVGWGEFISADFITVILFEEKISDQ